MTRGLPDVAVPLARATAGEQVTDALREAIMRGLFEDGQELNQEELASQFSVSRLPVREALRQLQAEGLVTVGPQRTAIVVGFDRRHVADVFELRALLESWMLERAAADLGPAELHELRSRCAEMLATEDPDLWLERKHEFHRHLLAPATSPVAERMIEQLMGQVERFVRRAGGMERRAAVDRAYTEILDSLEAGDVPDARGRLDRLLRETGEFVLDGGESAGS